MKKSLLNWASLGALTIACPALAQAQEPPVPSAAAQVQDEAQRELDIVVVTARKRQENVQDVPAVITALGSQKIEELGGVKDTRDLVQLLPGVTFIDAASSTVAEPNIRGAGQARLPNSDTAIGLYRDGAYIAGGNLGGRSFQRFDLFDVERIEVLRGPQGALYGRNAVGGAMNVISQLPEFDSTGFASASYGSRDTLGFQGVYNEELTDTIAVRLGGDYTNQADCVYTRSDTGGCFDNLLYSAGRGSLRWHPIEQFDVTWTSDYSDTRSGSGGGTISRIGNPPIDVIETNGRDEFFAVQSAHTLQLRYDLDWAQIYSTSNFRRRNSTLYSDPDGLATDTAQDRRADDTETAFQEVRLQGDTTRLNWLVGADLFYLKNDYLVEERGRDIIAGMMGAPSVNPNSDVFTSQDQNSFGLYGSLEYSIGDLTFQGEARYSVDDKSIEIDAVTEAGDPRFVDFPPGSPQASPSESFDNTSWGATVSYHVTDDLMIFGRAATAYRAGGFNSELGNPCDQPGEVPGTNCNVIDVPADYDPETSLTYEIGIKSSWFDNRLNINVNAYTVDYSDLLANLNNGVMAMADPLNNAMFLANAGDATANGFEVEMVARPPLPESWGDLDISANYSAQDGEFKEPPAFLTSVSEGNSLARLRPNAASANVIYGKNLVRDWRLRASLSYRHESGGYDSATNTDILDNFDTVGARVAVENEKMVFALKASNLGDQRYYVNQGGGTVAPGLSELYRLNDPRYVEASVTYRW